MAYSVRNFKTKKELKEAVASGVPVTCYHPGIGEDLTNYTGHLALEGPHYPEPHRWYASVEVVDGKVVKVL